MVLLLPACASSPMDHAYSVNHIVHSKIKYENVNRNAKPLAEILAKGAGNCADIAAYKQHLLKQKGIKSYLVKGVTPDYQQHAVVMFYYDGERWFLDNRNAHPTQSVFKSKFYNLDTGGVGYVTKENI